MKKINNMGFTLIELLAVITIMGILMMVAIPAVSRTIENSRRDTFADTVKTYIRTVRNAVLADELECGPSGSKVSVSATQDGTYYFKINTASPATQDIMEKVAKSPWGNAELIGYIRWDKKSITKASGELTAKTTYSAFIGDSNGRGMKREAIEDEITRSKIATSGVSVTETSKPTSPLPTPTPTVTPTATPSPIVAQECTIK